LVDYFAFEKNLNHRLNWEENDTIYFFWDRYTATQTNWEQAVARITCLVTTMSRHDQWKINGARPSGARLTIETRKEHCTQPMTDAAIVLYIKLAKENDLDVNQMAIAFVNSQPFVTSTLY
jgi:hypothetical protein